MSEHGEPELQASAEGARRKSRQALASARVLLDADDAEGAIKFFQLHHGCRGFVPMAGSPGRIAAALESVGEIPKTHSGTLDRFWTRFVRSDRFPRALGKAMHVAFDARHKADYNFINTHDTAAAADLLSDVERFCEAAEALMDNCPRTTTRDAHAARPQ